MSIKVSLKEMKKLMITHECFFCKNVFFMNALKLKEIFSSKEIFYRYSVLVVSFCSKACYTAYLLRNAYYIVHNHVLIKETNEEISLICINRKNIKDITNKDRC